MTIKQVRLLTETLPSGITRWMDMQAGWDYGLQKGCHGAELVFGLSRGKVAVVLNWMAPFYLKETRARTEVNGGLKYCFDGLGNIAFHSPIKTEEYQTVATHDCKYYTGGDCYTDSSGLAACDLFDEVVVDPDKLWPKLEEWLVKQEQAIETELAAQRNAG